MTRAEEAALRAYPPTFSSGKKDAKRIQAESVDTHQPIRTIFIRAYEQAEKDLMLTWEDIAKIDAIIMDVNNELAIDNSKEISRQKFYKEVLKRFNELKK